jgi:hypothetical protein
MFKLLIISIKLFSRTDTFDILVLTQKELEPHIRNISDNYGIPINTKYLSCETPEQAAAARLHIFEYEEIDKYSKILYLDTDILIQNDLTKFFEFDMEDKLYAKEEGNISMEYFGSWFFDFTTIDKETPGFNTGVLLFQNSPTMKNLFNKTLESITHCKQHSNRGMPRCWEQPFINYNAIHNNLFNAYNMDKYVFIYSYDNATVALQHNSILLHAKNEQNIVNHIAIGNKGYMNYVLNLFIENYINNSNNTVLVDNVLNKNFTWKNEYIHFCKDNTLFTPHGITKYRLLNTNVVETSWNNSHYCIIFDQQFKTYVSVKVGDVDIDNGKLIL